jgi:hypothetical protein
MHKNKNFLELYEKQSTRNLININLKKIEEIFSSKNILNDELRHLLLKLKEMEKSFEEEKGQLAIKRKAELNRMGKEFLLNDYKRRFNTDLRTVISAIAGEDSVNYELLKLERDKKVISKIKYFIIILNLSLRNLWIKSKCVEISTFWIVIYIKQNKLTIIILIYVLTI